MNKRTLAIDKIRVLLVAMLLICSANVMSQERTNGSQMVSAAELSAGGLIAFSANNQIYVMNADGSDLRLLTDGVPGVINRYPAFSPDGSRLAFIRYEPKDRGFSLSVVGVDGGGLQVLLSSSGIMGEPAWSPDGSKIAFIRGQDMTAEGAAYLAPCGSQIYVVDVFTRKDTNLTLGAGGTDPSWSPDGTRIAFSSYRDGSYEIYTMDPNGNDVQRLTYTAWAEAEPAWSPDGKKIAYAAHLRQQEVVCGFIPTGRPGPTDDEASNIYVMDADGANQTKLEITVGGIEPAWSPDGAGLALVIYNEWDGSQVYATEANGTRLVKLTSDSNYKSSPSWSNAGR